MLPWFQKQLLLTSFSLNPLIVSWYSDVIEAVISLLHMYVHIIHLLFICFHLFLSVWTQRYLFKSVSYNLKFSLFVLVRRSPYILAMPPQFFWLTYFLALQDAAFIVQTFSDWDLNSLVISSRYFGFLC